MHSSSALFRFLASSLLLLSACGSDSDEVRASALMAPLNGGMAMGNLQFLEAEHDGSRHVQLDITLSQCPEGIHGFHIHEGTSCGNNGDDALGHWNPTGEAHGRYGQTPFHQGDIGNVTCNAQGQGTLSIEAEGWTLDNDPNTGILGRAAILHANEDTYVQPTGNAGGRIACGLITLDGA